MASRKLSVKERRKHAAAQSPTSQAIMARFTSRHLPPLVNAGDSTSKTSTAPVGRCLASSAVLRNALAMPRSRRVVVVASAASLLAPPPALFDD